MNTQAARRAWATRYEQRADRLERWLDKRIGAVNAYLRQAAPSMTTSGRSTRPNRRRMLTSHPRRGGMPRFIDFGYVEPSTQTTRSYVHGPTRTRERAEILLYVLGRGLDTAEHLTYEDVVEILRLAGFRDKPERIADKMDELEQLRAAVLEIREAEMFASVARLTGRTA